MTTSTIAMFRSPSKPTKHKGPTTPVSNLKKSVIRFTDGTTSEMPQRVKTKQARQRNYRPRASQEPVRIPLRMIGDGDGGEEQNVSPSVREDSTSSEEEADFSPSPSLSPTPHPRRESEGRHVSMLSWTPLQHLILCETVILLGRGTEAWAMASSEVSYITS